MGYEIKLHFHPKKEEGVGYDADKKEVLVKKVGQPFEDIGLEQVAAAVMGQMARRDILIFDVEIEEYVRRTISFKECKDGKGIIIKGKRFSLDQTAKLVAEDVVEAPPVADMLPIPAAELPPGVQPHEVMRPNPQMEASQSIDNLYSQPNAVVPVKKLRQNMPPVNQKKVLYWVYFEPYMYEAEARSQKMRFQTDRKYPVHQIIPHPLGKLDAQKLVVTDDTGRPVEVDEKFFTSAGSGLMADNEVGFSRAQPRVRKQKLMYEDETIHQPVADMPANVRGIKVDDGTVPPEMMQVPDLRPGKHF